MNECLKLKINQKKVLILVLGTKTSEVINQPKLVREILKEIGRKMGIDNFTKNDDIYDLSIEQDYPDYIVRVQNDKISVIDII